MSTLVLEQRGVLCRPTRENGEVRVEAPRFCLIYNYFRGAQRSDRISSRGGGRDVTTEERWARTYLRLIRNGCSLFHGGRPRVPLDDRPSAPALGTRRRGDGGGERRLDRPWGIDCLPREHTLPSTGKHGGIPECVKVQMRTPAGGELTGEGIARPSERRRATGLMVTRSKALGCWW